MRAFSLSALRGRTGDAGRGAVQVEPSGSPAEAGETWTIAPVGMDRASLSGGGAPLCYKDLL
jgi:hypothetical protein